MFCRSFMLIFKNNFNDFIRPIISTSTAPILTKFAGLVELRPQMNDLKLLFRYLTGHCRGYRFCEPNPGPIHKIQFTCYLLDGGVRQEVQMLHWTQANQLTGQLTIINRRLGGHPRGLQSGLALHLVTVVGRLLSPVHLTVLLFSAVYSKHSSPQSAAH